MEGALPKYIIQPFLHVLAEMLDVQGTQLLAIDEETLRDGWRKQGFNPRPNGLQPLFSSFESEELSIDVEVRLLGHLVRGLLKPKLSVDGHHAFVGGHFESYTDFTKATVPNSSA